jgi:hypothetical protein
MYYYSNPAHISGCDPWDQSIQLCKEANVIADLKQTEYLPETLPFPGTFDLIYSFSVFTHLSQRATAIALRALRQSISSQGILVITVRPIEYWDISGLPNASEMRESHQRTGFAFMPHNREKVNGDITYGDTSVSADYLSNEFPQWKIIGADRSFHDPFQLYVFLKPS